MNYVNNDAPMAVYFIISDWSWPFGMKTITELHRHNLYMSRDKRKLLSVSSAKFLCCTVSFVIVCVTFPFVFCFVFFFQIVNTSNTCSVFFTLIWCLIPTSWTSKVLCFSNHPCSSFSVSAGLCLMILALPRYSHFQFYFYSMYKYCFASRDY